MLSGLGNVYGEHLLVNLVPGDKLREARVVDHLLMPHFETLYSTMLGARDTNSPSHILNIEYDMLGSRIQALASAVATVLKVGWSSGERVRLTCSRLSVRLLIM